MPMFTGLEIPVRDKIDRRLYCNQCNHDENHRLNRGRNWWIESSAKHFPLIKFGDKNLLVAAENEKDREKPDQHDRDNVEQVLDPARHGVVQQKNANVATLLHCVQSGKQKNITGNPER